jgi:cell division septal protein FtsQ
MARRRSKSKSHNKSTRRPGRNRVSEVRVRPSGPSRFRKHFLPAVISVAILACLATLITLGYRTVTASDFFDVKKIEISGVSRSSAEEVRRIVAGHSERTGAWNADLPLIRQSIEKLPFVKYAAVSRVLPNGIRVVITERLPIGILKTAGGSFLIDADGELLAPPQERDGELITITGWDQAKTERAEKENSVRIKMFQKMMSDWGEFGLVKRVKEVDVSDLLEPKAIVEDSGSRIAIILARDNFTKSLKSALEAIAGKGERVRSVDASGVYPVIEYIGAN